MVKIDWRGAVRRGAMAGVGVGLAAKQSRWVLWVMRVLLFAALLFLVVRCSA